MLADGSSEYPITSKRETVTEELASHLYADSASHPHHSLTSESVESRGGPSLIAETGEGSPSEG